jgi:hypothetical protein
VVRDRPGNRLQAALRRPACALAVRKSGNNRNLRKPGGMRPRDSRFSQHEGLRWAAGPVAASPLPGVPVTAPREDQASSIAATAANCASHLSAAHPNPGGQGIPRRLVMSGTATSGTGISQVQACPGNRACGGTFVGTAAFAPAGPTGAWSLAARSPRRTSLTGHPTGTCSVAQIPAAGRGQYRWMAATQGDQSGLDRRDRYRLGVQGMDDYTQPLQQTGHAPTGRGPTGPHSD